MVDGHDSRVHKAGNGSMMDHGNNSPHDWHGVSDQRSSHDVLNSRGMDNMATKKGDCF